MYNLIFSEEPQGDEQLYGEPANQRLTNTLKIVQFDKLIQIHRQHLKWKYQMPSEHERVQNAHNVPLVIIVFVL